MQHGVETLGEVWMRTLYLSPGLAPRGALAPDSGICVLEGRPLLRELILEASRSEVLEAGEPSHPHLAALIVDQLARATHLGLALPMPRDSRARRVAERARADLARIDTLAQLARDCGASARTIERLFMAETGLAFNQWRLQARLQHALRRLSESASVATVARECGYASVGAFVSMFRLALGVTPGQYLREASANAHAGGQQAGA